MGTVISLTENVNLKVVYWPKYNPWAIEVAMYSRGMTLAQLRKATGINNLAQIVKGEEEAHHPEILLLAEMLYYPTKFFEQYFESKIEWIPGELATTAPVRYCDYPIFMRNR